MRPDTYRKRLQQRPTKWLKSKAIETFNAYIRERDKDKPCISCGRFTELQAGHYFSAGKYESLRFNEKNVHGECLACNYFESKSDNKYRDNLITRIGQDEFEKLNIIRGMEKQNGHYKLDRFTLIDIIITYKEKI